MRDQVQRVERVLVNGPHRVVDEVGREQHREEQNLLVVLVSLLRGAETFCVDD